MIEHLRWIPDYRCGRVTIHNHVEMLACLIAGYLSGRTSVRRALDWCREHLDMLREHMELLGGIPSEATISRLLKGIDEELFSLTFTEWMSEIVGKSDLNIAIDGKALRGATERIRDGKTPYVLNAVETVTQLVLAQLPIDEKSNEITFIPMLLESLNIKENTFTIDAIGTQKKIEKMIVENGGHFVLQVKKNNPALYEEIMTEFSAFDEEYKLSQEERTKKLEPYIGEYERINQQEKNRERIEYRDIAVCGKTDFLNCVKSGEEGFIQSVARVIQVRVPIEKDANGNDITVSKEEFLANGSHRKPRPTEGDGIKDDIQRVGMISDLKLSASEMLNYKRTHWRIENGLHHVLDDTFREDRSPAKGGKNNLALIRKIAYNILRIAQIRDKPKNLMTQMMDYFCDHPEKVLENVFSPIAAF